LGQAMHVQEPTLAELTLAELIKEARVRARLSMRGLARRSGLSAAQISRIEAGEVERPAAETLVRLAKALDRDAQLLLVFAGHIRGARARQLLRQATEALPEPGRAGHADALARLEAEDEREQRLREELAEAESALAKMQLDLDEARRAAEKKVLAAEGERVAAEPLREARARVREVGLLGQRCAVEVAQKRRQFEQLDDAPSEEVCVFAGRLFLHAAARGDHLEAWRQFSGQITPDDPELRQLLQAWRQLEHERRKKVLEFSQDQLALSLLGVEKAILGSVRTPEEAFEIVRNVSSGWTAETGRPTRYSPAAEEAVRALEEREG
jgi:transcriptional regulator with XRE-family HTH domain